MTSQTSAPLLSHLYELLQHRAGDLPDTPAIGGQEDLGWRTLTSREFLLAAEHLAGELQQRGVREGDRVVLWVPNGWRTPVYFFALWRLGAIAVPFDREMNPEAGARIVASVEPRLVLVGYGERPAWAREIDVTDWWDPAVPEGSQPQAWTSPSEPLAGIYFTSGTTGNPKGCMITHSNLCSQVQALHATIPIDTSARLASVLPLSHLLELTAGLLYPLARGASVHYVPSRRGPDVLRTLQEQHITHMITVPQMLALMGQALYQRLQEKLPAPLYKGMMALAPKLPMAQRRALFYPALRVLGGQLNMMASGGAALPAETQLMWERMGVRIVQGYGTSECSPAIASAAGDGSTPVGSVGKAIPGVETRLSPEGELLVKGPNVMLGYWKDPARTAEVLQDGWYATGDLASIDPQGNIFLQGRAKDLIVLPSGMKVWPQDVEDVLREHPAVKDAAIIAVPTPGGGASLHAYLIPKSATPGAIDQVINACNARLAVHQRISTASWWPEPDFPRTNILKVKRHLLPKPSEQAAVKVETVSAADDPVAQAVAGIARVPSVLGTQTLGELGLDSLGLVELAIALEEKTGRAVAEESLRTDLTVDQLKEMLRTSGEASTVNGAHPVEQWRADQPLWPYTWGRIFRVIGFPVEIIYRWVVTKTQVVGAEHLAKLPRRVIFAGTHHGFADLPLVRHSLAQTPARRFSNKVVVASGAAGWSNAPLWSWYGVFSFGMFPLRQHQQRDVSLRRLLRLADMGNAILIFPQGTHARPDQEIADEPAVRFHTGVTHLAMSLEATVAPFGLAGTEKVMPPSTTGVKGWIIAGGIPMVFTKGPLAIAYGEPIPPPAQGENLEAYTQKLQDACYALTRLAEASIANAP